MKYYYDLHIHSALSPCGDNDMTPNNIVNMALIKGLDIIAVTDHNTCGNVRAVMAAAAGRLTVVPGLEVETAEEVHVVCYFPNIENAEAMSRAVQQHMPPVANRPDIFGRQYYMDAEDRVVGEEEILLVNATTLHIGEVFRLVKGFGGVAVPAHIDRPSYSILANLGMIPPDITVTAVEITSRARGEMEKKYDKYKILTNSDAHYLEDIAEPDYQLPLLSKNAEETVKYLCTIEENIL